ncbi:MAG TPA: TlpA family protein disulfide reductase, partial [Chromatiales bacterium]|nr:TlpA family protein disulfide reductase [Chromatiales bacterium]
MATTRMRQAVILSALVVIGIAAALFNKYYLDRLAMERAVSKEDDSALVGMPRPDFLLPDIDGFPRKISEWDGQVVALNFWASW